MNSLSRKILSTGPAKSAAAALLAKKDGPLYLACVLHSEAVQDPRVFEKLMSFAVALAFRPALCVMTPKNPYVRAEMDRLGVTEAEFTSRLRALSRHYDIGLHGHWCEPRPQGGPAAFFKPGRPTRIEEAGFALTLNDPEKIARQFREEHAYLAASVGTPLVYAAGWWFLDGAVLQLLGDYGFAADCSYRRGQPDSFGGAQAPEPAAGPGRAFYLPPAGTVLEIPSLFYIHLNWWSAARSALPLLRGRGGPLFASFPLHDYNLLDDDGRTADNIKLFCRFGGVRWLGVPELLQLAREDLKK